MVLPFHSWMRARTDLIFMMKYRVGGSNDSSAPGRDLPLQSGQAHATGDLESIGCGLCIGLALAGDIKSSTVCGGRNGNRETALNRYSLGKTHQLDGDLALVVVHRHDRIQFSITRFEEDGVSWKRA